MARLLSGAIARFGPRAQASAALEHEPNINLGKAMFQPMAQVQAPPPSTRLLGVRLDLTTPAELLAFAADRAEARDAAVIANHNTHSLHLLDKAPELAAFFAAADRVVVDSVPIIAWGRVVDSPLRRRHRCTYLDWRDDFWAMASAKGWRVFYLGGAPGVAAQAADSLSARWPGASIRVHDGYFDMTSGSADSRRVCEAINAFAPHILLVGMGMPRQEQWILRNRSALGPTVIFSVGAAFDYEAGVQTAAPRWMGRMGIEWLFRLVHDPRRLFVRYVLEPWTLLPRAGQDVGQALSRWARSRRPSWPEKSTPSASPSRPR